MGKLRNWLRLADLDAGRRTDGLTTEERDILEKATAWFAREAGARKKRSDS